MNNNTPNQMNNKHKDNVINALLNCIDRQRGRRAFLMGVIFIELLVLCAMGVIVVAKPIVVHSLEAKSINATAPNMEPRTETKDKFEF